MKIDLTKVSDVRSWLHPLPLSTPMAVIANGKNVDEADIEIANGVVCITVGEKSLKTKLKRKKDV